MRPLSHFKSIFFIAVGFLIADSALASTSAERAYQKARKEYYALISSQQTGLESEWQICVQMFRDVATKYPKSRRAPDALFTQGLLFWNMHQRFGKIESLYKAVRAYEELVEKYPSNSLADDAIYNVGVIYYDDLGNKERSLKMLNDLVARYPRSEMAKQARSFIKKLESGVKPIKPQVAEAPPKKSIVETPPERVVPKRKTPQTTAQPASNLRIEDIRYWSNPDYTRVSIYLNGETEFQHNMLNKDSKLKVPYRLYLDIQKTQLSKEIARKIKISNGILQRVRSGQYKADVARVVLDMESVHDYHISYRSDPHRIVIDVQGKQPQRTVVEVPVVKDKSSEAKQAEAKGKPTIDSIIARTPSIKVPEIEIKNLDDPSYTVDLDKAPVRTIIIDPGHGGEDPGAKGPRGTAEKDVVLGISLKLRDALSKYRNIRVVMTRERDIFIPLPQRSKIANKERGDLFVSLHADASRRRSASGVSTYIFDNAQDEYSRQLEERENASILRG